MQTRLILTGAFLVAATLADPSRALASLMVFASPTTFTSSTQTFSGSLNGGEAGWLAQLGNQAQSFSGTVTRQDLDWQCTTASCNPNIDQLSTTTTTSNSLDTFTIKFEGGPSGDCTTSPGATPVCAGTLTSNFLLSQPIFAFGATISISTTLPSNVTFDGVPIIQFPVNTFVNTPLRPDLFFGVISDTPLTSFDISGPGCCEDGFLQTTFSNVLVSPVPVDEPPTVMLFSAFFALLLVSHIVRRELFRSSEP